MTDFGLADVKHKRRSARAYGGRCLRMAFGVLGFASAAGAGTEADHGAQAWTLGLETCARYIETGDESVLGARLKPDQSFEVLPFSFACGTLGDCPALNTEYAGVGGVRISVDWVGNEAGPAQPDVALCQVVGTSMEYYTGARSAQDAWFAAAQTSGRLKALKEGHAQGCADDGRVWAFIHKEDQMLPLAMMRILNKTCGSGQT